MAIATADSVQEQVAGAGRRLRLARPLSWVAVLAPPLLFTWGGWRRRWISEDGFITLRVVTQILHGHGPVFNVGDRVEASTSPLWTGLLALVRFLLPVRLEVLAVALGLIASAAGLALACLAARRLWPGTVVVPFGGLVVLAVPPFRDFVTSGLETGLMFAWMGAAAWVLVAEASSAGSTGRWGPVVAGLGPLVRPDLTLVAGPALVALAVLRGGGRRRVVGALAGGVALPLAWQVFRMGYYGALVPNTAIAKEGAAAWWSQGWWYLCDFARPYRLALPLAVITLVIVALVSRGGWRTTVAALAIPVGALLHGLYVVRVGGDFMHGRLLLPALFGLCLPVMVIAPRRLPHWVALAVVGVWAVAVVANHARPAYEYWDDRGIADERVFWVISARHPHPVLSDDYRTHVLWQEGDFAAERVRQGGSGLALRPEFKIGWLGPAEYTWIPFAARTPVAVGLEHAHVGIVGMVAGIDVRVIDVFGLADPLAARMRIDLKQRGRPGHEKHLGRHWLWARDVAPGTPPFPAGPAPAQVAAASEALHCRALVRLSNATTAPLTAGRFLQNLLDAFRLHGLRIDPDPTVTRRELCGQ
jgi:arabinofuranosyltransferase